MSTEIYVIASGSFVVQIVGETSTEYITDLVECYQPSRSYYVVIEKNHVYKIPPDHPRYPKTWHYYYRCNGENKSFLGNLAVTSSHISFISKEEWGKKCQS